MRRPLGILHWSNKRDAFVSRWVAVVLVWVCFATGRGTAAEFVATSWVPQKDRAVLVHVPEGTKRLRLQTRALATAAWEVVGVVHLEGRAGTLKMRLPDGVALENVLLESSSTDPFPSSFYQGQTSFRGATAAWPGGIRGGGVLAPGAANDAVETDPGPGTTVVEESDIWKWRGRTLYYFNSMRGLQVFDLGDFEHPRRVGGLRMPAVGEDMYLVGADHVALLANRYDYGWNGSPSRHSEVVVVRHAGSEITEAARVAIEGSFLESRLIGTTLCVVTQKVELITAENGAQSYVPKTQVYALDLADPAHPQIQGPLAIGNEDDWWTWRTVVHATPEFLFVATDSWREGAGPRTRVHVIDLRSPSQPLTVAARFDLRGQLQSKFQLTYANGILTTVSQNAGAVIETWDIATALDEGTAGVARLDSLTVGANESVFGTRFDGDRVYVVTFRRIDPLFCVDLGDPRNLRLLGELEVPGFSTYLDAFADGSRLLSVGVEGGRVAVSLFDVADPAHPAMKGRVRFGDEAHWSWSEANYDDKAIGFFRPEGLLVIPLSEWTPEHGYRTGMQIVDATADGLRTRGFVDHRFSARRGRLFDQTLVSIGGTELYVIDLADRDSPRKVASVTIAWPVQEALPIGDSLVQLESGDGYAYATQPPRSARLHITPKSDPDGLTADIDLGFAGEVAGATVRGDRLYAVLRTSEYRVIQGADGPRDEWVTGLTTLIVTLADLAVPRVEGSVQSLSEPNRWGSGHLDAHWLPDGRLLWHPSRTAGNSWFRCFDCPIALDVAGVGGGAAVGIGGPWWWGGMAEDFLVVDVTDSAAPRVVAREPLVADAEIPQSSRAFLAADDRLLASWTTWRQEGNVWSEESFVQEIDLSNSAAPRRGPKASVPGLVDGVHRTDEGGTVLFASRTEMTTNPDNSTLWTNNALVDALAYDGTQAFLLDTARAANSASMSSETIGPNFLIAVQPWLAADPSKGALHVLSWDAASGKLGALPDIALGPGWPTLQNRSGLLFAFGSNRIDVIAAHQLPAPPASTTIHVDVPLWNYASLVLDPGLPTAWQPADSYGVERLDLGSLPLPPSTVGHAPRDRASTEWHAVAFLTIDVVAANGTDSPGALGAGDDFRFVSDSEAETYSQWQHRYFSEPADPSAGALSDPDGDGFGNYAEWAFGASPVDPNSQPEVAAARVSLKPGEPDRLVLVARINPLANVDESPFSSYLSLNPQLSTDLITWRNAQPTEVEIIATPLHRLYVLPAPEGATSVFGRLLISFVIEG